MLFIHKIESQIQENRDFEPCLSPHLDFYMQIVYTLAITLQLHIMVTGYSPEPEANIACTCKW